MFKSKFANALTTMMIGSLGIAAVENKLSVGYGAEAGHMDPLVAKMCARYCKNSLVITRNEESRTILSELGVPTQLGTDTAWTFEPKPAEYGQSVLRQVGWDGKTPVLVVCPINPFEWPVKASVAKYALHSLAGAYKDSHYRTVYFHNSGPAADRAYQHYLTSIANAVDAFRKQRNVFVILVATERLDARPANRISERLGGVPVLTSDQYNMYELVSILRSCHMMASSRYHGIVTSMPALVPSAGITMDERIRNLMRERGHQELLMTVDDPDLEPKLLAALNVLATRRRAYLRWHRTHGREESESHGADGSVLRRGSPAALSRIPDAHWRVELGGLPAAHERVAAAVGIRLQLVVPGPRTRCPSLETSSRNSKLRPMSGSCRRSATVSSPA